MTTTMEKKSTMKWYVVRAQSNRERSVSEKLIKEGENGDLIGRIGQVIVPMEKIFQAKDGKKTVKEKVLFPGYIFVETNAIGELKYFIKGLSGATGFLTNRAGTIETLTQSEVDKMIGIHTENQEKELSTTFFVGEEVKILDGPFTSFNGVIDEIKDQRVVVSVSIFGRKTPVELNTQQIDKK
jgi:transcriptional antiterminator NusG